VLLSKFCSMPKPMAKPKPKRRQRLLEYIEAYCDREGHAPTIREMAAGAGISSTSVVQYHLDALIKLGYLERDPNTIRGIRTNGIPAVPLKRLSRDGRRVMGGRAKHTLNDIRPGVTGCMLCGAEGVPLELDHFYPLSRGGVDADHNWILLCQDCNRKKSDKEPVSFVLDNYGVKELKAIIAFLLTEGSNDNA